MPTERTPLIQTVRVAPVRRRYPHQTCRRFFTIVSCALLVTGFVTFAVHAFLIWPKHYHRGHHGHGPLAGGRHGRMTPEELQSILFNTPDPDKAREWSQYYTSGVHLAGTNLSQAEWTRERWVEWGVRSEIVSYDVYINYPVDHSLSILEKSKDDDSWNVTFKASLEEDPIDEDPTTSLQNRIPTFHGYSASGNVTASYVYVNYGTYHDFNDLVNAGIDLKGKIAIVRYGGIFRGLKIKRAQELGMIGCLIYSDPGDDGERTDEHGYKTYPEGPARNPSSVQRGSAEFLSIRPGDPSTPGYPSKPGVPRLPVDDATPSIPSIPISYVDALPILKALNGHGPKASDFNEYWNKNLGLAYKGVEYNIGPSPENIVLNLYNEQEYVTTPLWDVIGIVNGTIPNEVIVVGNHRDAWIVGGAGDPNSGSAVLNEVIRGIGKALEAGWKPLRTIVFASWDGEEYSLIGSTEWVEEYLPWLSDASVAYINVDVGVNGPKFTASAAPLLNKLLRDVTSLVPSPNQTVPGQTVGDVWDGRISTMGSGSDFTAFQDYAGIPCIDMGFKFSDKSAVYHYHSNYDSFHWMTEYGDVGFKYHKAMAQILGLTIAKISESYTIPFGATEYADALHGYLDKVEAKLDPQKPTNDEEIFAIRASLISNETIGSEAAFRKWLGKIRSSLNLLRIKCDELDESAAWVNRQIEVGIPWWNIVERIRVGLTLVKVNKAYKNLERKFLYPGGLDGRNWFKHVVFAPGLWTGYSGAVFPGLMESIDAKNFASGVRWAYIIDQCVSNAIESLE